MRRFRFRLAVVERAERARHEGLRRELGLEAGAARAAAERAAAAGRRADETLDHALERARRVVPAGDLALACRLARRTRGEAAHWTGVARRADARCEELADQLRGTWRRLDGLERARARAHRAWRRMVARAEQRTSDEWRPRAAAPAMTRRGSDADE